MIELGKSQPCMQRKWKRLSFNRLSVAYWSFSFNYYFFRLIFVHISSVVSFWVDIRDPILKKRNRETNKVVSTISALHAAIMFCCTQF